MTPSPSAIVASGPVAFLWTYIKRRPIWFGGVFFAVMAAASCSVLVQWGMKMLVDAMSSPDRRTADVWTPLWFFIGLIATENALWRLGGWCGCRAVVGCGVDIRLDLYQHLSGHSLRFFDEHLSGSLGGRATATAGAAGALLSTFIWHILPLCTDFAGTLIVLFTVDGRIALALIVFVLVAGVGITAFGIRGRPLHRAYAEQASKVSGELVDVLLNIWTVQAFNGRQRERARLAVALEAESLAQRRSWLYLEKARVLHDVALVAMAACVLVWTITLWRNGEVTAGSVVIVSALTFRMLHGSRDLALALVGTSQQFGAVADTLRVIAIPHATSDAADASAWPIRAGRIELRQVTFAYPGRDPVFRALDLCIEAGQKVGIVGPSGAGKSTLVALLQRLDDVQDGCILIDGHPVQTMTQESLRAAIAVVPQDIALFHRSIGDNIRFGRANATDDEVRAAAKAAHCEDFIENLPQGYDTLVGERGARLSGGQRQRLGIARAFLKDAPILIFDEATSALDTHSEHEIQSALDRLTHGRTVIAIAHRLSTVTTFDRIVVFDEGRVVEDGPPAVLRQQGGVFGSLWRLQAESEKNDVRSRT